MTFIQFWFGHAPCRDYVMVYNNSSKLYIASKVVKKLNKNPNFPAIAYLDGDSIGQKPLKLNEKP